jgi:hypothetical protein
MTSNDTQEGHVSCDKSGWQLAVALNMPTGILRLPDSSRLLTVNNGKDLSFYRQLGF